MESVKKKMFLQEEMIILAKNIFLRNSGVVCNTTLNTEEKNFLDEIIAKNFNETDEKFEKKSKKMGTKNGKAEREAIKFR